MAQKWFVQKDDVIDGPFNAADVHARVQSGQFGPHHLIWGKGLSGWRKLEWWLSEGAKAVGQVGEASEPVTETWHYAFNGKSHGPFSKVALVSEIKSKGALSEIMVWTKGMTEWAPLFEFHDLLTAVGANKRQFARAELSGRVTIKTTESTLVAEAATISEGGCGVRLDGGLVPGQPLTLEIQSPAFRETLHAKAQCRYFSDGYCGIKFTQLSSETKGAIVQYVRQSQTRFVLKAA